MHTDISIHFRRTRNISSGSFSYMLADFHFQSAKALTGLLILFLSLESMNTESIRERAGRCNYL